MANDLTKDSTVADFIELFNSGAIKYQDTMNLFAVSRDLIKARLTGIGFHYDNQEKKFVGEASKDKLNMQLSQLFERQRKRLLPKDSEEKHNASIETSEQTATTIELPVEQKANKNKVKASQKQAPTKAPGKAASELDAIDRLLLQNEHISRQKVYRGFYWDADIIDFIDNVKHGNKSELMNEIVRSVLLAKGLIK